MTDVAAHLEPFEARSIEQALDQLAALGRAWKARSDVRLPQISLHLRWGSTLSGVLIDLHEPHRGERTILLVPRGASEVVLVPSSSVGALTIHDPQLLGQQQQTPPQEVSSFLALARQAQALRGDDDFEVELQRPADDRGLQALGALVYALESTLRAVRADELGRSALGGIRRFVLSLGVAPDVTRSGDVVHLVSSSERVRLSADVLRAKLDALL
ncbi:MAG: hypothetical protein H6730_33205 [Deltaproteobacteria bacterium]|nr:hypothetical protein [Deltaproteobacteria bacterium]